jgi:hypothetical protein
MWTISGVAWDAWYMAHSRATLSANAVGGLVFASVFVVVRM